LKPGRAHIQLTILESRSTIDDDQGKKLTENFLNRPSTISNRQYAAFARRTPWSAVPPCRFPSANLLAIHRSRHRLVSALLALFLAFTLNPIFGLTSPSSAIATSAAAQGSRQERDSKTAASPQSLPELPKVCLDPTKAKGKIADMLDTVRAHPTADAWNALGALYAQSDMLACATSAFEMALRLQPDSEEARYNLALALIKGGKPSQATRELQRLIRQKPQFAGAHYALGIVLGGEGKPDAAEREFEAAIRSDPHFYVAYLNLAELLGNENKHAAAISCLERALALKPPREVAGQLQTALDKVRAETKGQRLAAEKKPLSAERAAGQLNNQANQLLAEGKVQEAVDAYRKALQLNPHYAQGHYNLSLALDKLGQLSEEQQQLEEAVKLDPALGVARDQLGLLALRSGTLDKAEQEFKSALAANPRDAEAQDSLGVLYNREGKDAQAETMFQRSIESDPKYAKAYFDLGMALAQRGQYAEAEKQLQTGIKMAPDDERGFTGLGMLLAKTGREAEAIPNFRKAVALDPGSPDAHVNLGIALADQYDLAGGLAEFSEAIRLDPHSSKAHYNLGRFYFYTGKYAEAQKELETACQIQPDYPGALYSLALDERQLNNVPRATELLEKVVTLNPGNADAQYLLGQNLDRLGKKDEAIAHWKIAVQADPNQSQSLYNLARALEERHDPEALQYMERFQALEKSNRLFDRVQALGNFAIEAANAQNLPQAVEQMQEAIQLCGQCAESAHLHRNLGLIYCRTGNTQEGEKELRAALQINPHDEDASKALALLEKVSSRQ
jgi:tetratricopeptide (TPR) repeat protein